HHGGWKVFGGLTGALTGFRRSISGLRPSAIVSLIGKRVWAAFPEALDEGERFFGRAGAVHAKALGGEAFVQKLAQAFFVVEDQDAAALKDFGRRVCSRGLRGRRRRVRGYRGGGHGTQTGFRGRRGSRHRGDGTDSGLG